MLDYYYGPEAEQFAFYRIPKILFEAENVSLSTDAKLLYGIFLDRMQLSAKNKWLDDNGRVYIFFTVKQIMKALQISNKTATKLLHERENTGFIEREKQGLTKPDRIYVKNFLSVVYKGNLRTCKNNISGDEESTSHKDKHKTMKESVDVIKIKTYAVINLNNMIPVPDSQIVKIDINKEKDLNYRYLLQAESREVNRQRKRIRKNTEIVYNHKKRNGDSTPLAKRTTDFELLERLCGEY